ncbi:MAG: hypothetical protein AB7F75_02130 [Planctomycetota bacterium]
MESKKWLDKALNGMSLNDTIFMLKQEGLSIIDSIIVVRDVHGLSLGQSKIAVTSHPCWVEFVQASEPLHDELEKLAEDINARRLK